MYDVILAPTDGSSPANRAVDSAVSIAKRFDARVRAIYVMGLQDIPERVPPDIEDMIRERGQSALDTAVKGAEDVGYQLDAEMVRGMDTVHHEIIEYGIEHGADLIVMGSRGATGLDRIVLGSVAQRTINTSPIPVLTIKEVPIGPSIERVLVPTDGSEGAEAAAAHAIDVADAMDATLHVIHAIEVAGMGGEPLTGAVYEALESVGQAAVGDVVDRARERGLDEVESTVLTGRASRAIGRYAEEANIDLTVLGTHGRSGIERVLLGSVAERVVRTVPTPVLTVNERARRERFE